MYLCTLFLVITFIAFSIYLINLHYIFWNFYSTSNVFIGVIDYKNNINRFNVFTLFLDIILKNINIKHWSFLDLILIDNSFWYLFCKIVNKACKCNTARLIMFLCVVLIVINYWKYWKISFKTHLYMLIKGNWF